MTTNQPPRKVRVLTRLKIGEVSLVDRGAGESCRVLISKRGDDADPPPPLSNAEKARARIEGRMAIRHQEEIEAREKRDRDDAQIEFFRGIFKGEIDVIKAFAADARGDEATRDDERTPADELAGDPPPPDVPEPVTDKTIRMDLDANRTLIARDQRALARWLAVQERIHKSTTPET